MEPERGLLDIGSVVDPRLLFSDPALGLISDPYPDSDPACLTKVIPKTLPNLSSRKHRSKILQPLQKMIMEHRSSRFYNLIFLH